MIALWCVLMMAMMKVWCKWWWPIYGWRWPIYRWRWTKLTAMMKTKSTMMIAIMVKTIHINCKMMSMHMKTICCSCRTNHKYNKTQHFFFFGLFVLKMKLDVFSLVDRKRNYYKVCFSFTKQIQTILLYCNFSQSLSLSVTITTDFLQT